MHSVSKINESCLWVPIFFTIFLMGVMSTTNFNVLAVDMPVDKLQSNFASNSSNTRNLINSPNESNGIFRLNVFLDGFLGSHNPVAVCVTVLEANLAECKTFDLYNLTQQQFPGEQDIGHKLNGGLFEFPIYDIPPNSFLEACLIDLISHTVGCTAMRYDGEINNSVDIDIDSMESEE